MSCNCVSRGINDDISTVSFLATRIFDNVRMDLDRTEAVISASLPDGATPLYASGTGTAIQQLTVAPRACDGYSAVTGNLSLPCTLTYLSGGESATVPCTVSVPLSVRLFTPDGSVWPYDITLNYSCFADNISPVGNGSFSCLTDGVSIAYVTSLVPVNVPFSGTVMYNSVSERSIDTRNGFVTSDFYPSAASGSKNTVI